MRARGPTEYSRCPCSVRCCAVHHVLNVKRHCSRLGLPCLIDTHPKALGPGRAPVPMRTPERGSLTVVKIRELVPNQGHAESNSTGAHGEGTSQCRRRPAGVRRASTEEGCSPGGCVKCVSRFGGERLFVQVSALPSMVCKSVGLCFCGFEPLRLPEPGKRHSDLPKR